MQHVCAYGDQIAEFRNLFPLSARRGPDERGEIREPRCFMPRRVRNARLFLHVASLTLQAMPFKYKRGRKLVMFAPSSFAHPRLGEREINPAMRRPL